MGVFIIRGNLYLIKPARLCKWHYIGTSSALTPRVVRSIEYIHNK